MRIAPRPLLACMMLSLAAPPSVCAAGDTVLSKVMETQGRSMQLIAGAIAREDYGEVAAGAMAVIGPSHPPAALAEKLELMRFLGGKAGRFRGLDRDTKERAAALVKAVRARDGEATIGAFQRLQTSCLACHAEFRKPFRDHFKRE